MKNKTYLSPFIHYSIYFIASLFFAYYLDISMPDDGLRHIAFAANQDLMKSWGEVFPYSLFSDYDPWFLWHNLLSSILIFVNYKYLHICINFVVFFSLMNLIDIHLRKLTTYNFASFIYIIVFSIIFLGSSRYLMIRPDLLSGLYVMTALLLGNRPFVLFLITVIYGPFYYLFFMYTGSIGLVFLIQKKWNTFLGVFVGSVFVLMIHFLYDYNGYVDTVINILMDQKLRMGLEVGEGRPLFDFLKHFNYFILLPIFFIGTSFFIYKKYDYFKENALSLFILITSILWMNQVRYFVLFLPIIIVYIFSIVVNTNKKKFFRKVRMYYIVMLRYISYSKKVALFYLIAIPYCIFAFTYVYDTKSMNKGLEEASFFNNEIFNKKTILMNNLHVDIYKALYYNPTIKFVPSCSVGWFDNKDEKMKDIYIRMQKEKGISEIELKSLINYINADFYIHYLRNAKQVLDFDKLKELGINPEIIYHNRIIFKINKEDKNE